MPKDTVNAPAPSGSLDAFLLYAVRYGLFAVFILPFVVLLQHLYPWVSGKIWGFELIIELLFPLYVLLAFRRREFRPKKSFFLYAMLAYFAIATLAMLIGDNPHRSMWSKPDRLTGMFFQYHLLAFFLMAGSVWRGMAVQPIVATVLTSVLLSFHAMRQAFFPEPGTDGRGSATLGNASYLGQFLVPHLFLCGWLLRRHWRTGLRYAWMATSVVIALGIFSTKSKGALIGVFIGAVVLCLVAAFRGTGRLRTLARWGLSALAAAVVLFLLGHKIPSVNTWLYNQRLSLQFIQETSGSRKLLLENAVKVFKARPLLGWGPENFEGGFYEFYDPVTLRYSEYESRQDRPHNLVLEILANLGVIGLLAYAAVFVGAARTALKPGDREAEGGEARTLFIGGALLFVAALSQLSTNLFIFETPMSYIALFLMFALLGAHEPAGEAAGSDELSNAAVPLAMIAAAVAIWSIGWVQIGSIRGARLTSELITSLSQPLPPAQFQVGVGRLMEQKTPMLERYLRAITSHLSRPRGFYLSAGGYGEILGKLADEEYAFLQRNRRDYVHGLVTMSAYMSLASRTAEQQAAMEDALSIARARSPRRHEVAWYGAQALIEKGDLDGAEALMREADGYDSASSLGAAALGGFLLEHRDDVDGAVEVLAPKWKGITGRRDAWDMIEIATLHIVQAKRFETLARMYDAMAAHDLWNLEWTLMGAIAAYADGDEAKAEAIVAEAKRRFPQDTRTIDAVVADRNTIISDPAAAVGAQ